MARGLPSMTALALAGYQNRDKISEMPPKRRKTHHARVNQRMMGKPVARTVRFGFWLILEGTVLRLTGDVNFSVCWSIVTKPAKHPSNRG